MKHPHDLPDGAFPFLPGESARLPNVDPHVVWGDRRDVPPWIIVTLKLLRDGANPQGSPPVEWLGAIDGNEEVRSAIRSVADEQLGISAVTFDERDRSGAITGSYMTWSHKNTQQPIEEAEVWKLVWPIYCAALSSDLETRGETPEGALERLDRHWAQYQSWRERQFLGEYMDRDVWSPAMAAAWIMFGGRSECVAEYFNCNGDTQICGVTLSAMGSSVDGALADKIVDRQPAKTLLAALQRSQGSTTRVVAKGYLYPDGAFAELSPAELSRFDWDWNAHDANNLKRDDWRSTNRTVVYTGVVIDCASLFRFVAPLKNEACATHDGEVVPQRKKAGRKPTETETAKEALRSLVKKHGRIALEWKVPALQAAVKEEYNLNVKDTTMRGAKKEVRAEH